MLSFECSTLDFPWQIHPSLEILESNATMHLKRRDWQSPFLAYCIIDKKQRLASGPGCTFRGRGRTSWEFLKLHLLLENTIKKIALISRKLDRSLSNWTEKSSSDADPCSSLSSPEAVKNQCYGKKAYLPHKMFIPISSARLVPSSGRRKLKQRSIRVSYFRLTYKYFKDFTACMDIF